MLILAKKPYFVAYLVGDMALKEKDARAVQPVS